jgi:hypothetical protein
MKMDFPGSKYLVLACDLFYDAEHISDYIVWIAG